MVEITGPRPRPGPRSQFRPKMYDRRVSAALTAEGWKLLDKKIKAERCSVADWIEMALRADDLASKQETPHE